MHLVDSLGCMRERLLRQSTGAAIAEDASHPRRHVMDLLVESKNEIRLYEFNDGYVH